MKLDQVISLLQGKMLTKDANLNREIKGGCGADLMSDVLASAQPDALLLTGLCSPQVVRTAQMADVAAIVIVRGKMPPQETVDLAEQERIPLISTRYGMLEACGRLYQAGLISLETPAAENART
jgi:predicted transcriptional regulator